MMALFRMSSFLAMILMMRNAIFEPPVASISSSRESIAFDDIRCPPGFDLVRSGQCRGLATREVFPLINAINSTIKICTNLNASPVIIRDQEDQKYWAITSAQYFRNVIGIVCNYSTSKWQWVDGSDINYKPVIHSDMSAPCINKTGTWAIFDNGNWTFFNDWREEKWFDISCTVDLTQPTNKECADFDYFEKGSICYQAFNTSTNWTIAQKFCESVGATLASLHSEPANAFLKSLAQSRGIVNGVLLGANSTAKLDAFKWIDGSAMNYSNFVPGFPMRGFGNCLAMTTNGVSGQWANTDCSISMPFACSRKPFSEGAPTTCQGASVKEGEIIVSPGFPLKASTPCDYSLKVDVGGLVEVEIILLEANSCCDNLVLSDGSAEGIVIANLTGTMTGVKYRSITSNIMKVSWQPRDGTNVRGLVMSFRGV